MITGADAVTFGDPAPTTGCSAKRCVSPLTLSIDIADAVTRALPDVADTTTCTLVRSFCRSGAFRPSSLKTVPLCSPWKAGAPSGSSTSYQCILVMHRSG